MDLNVIIGDSSQSKMDNDQTIRDKLERCKLLGFTEVAVSIIVDATIKTTAKQANLVPSPPDIKHLIPSRLKVYTRLTIKVEDPGQLYKISSATNRFDLLALQPMNSKMLQYISNGNTQLDILSLDLTERLDNNFFKISCKVLEKRGVCMEINYGPAQLGSSLRRSIICNGQGLTEKSYKNIILSSGIDDVFRLRGPQDAKCLGVLFMMSLNSAHDAVYKNGQKAISSSKVRKNPVSSAIEVVKIE